MARLYSTSGVLQNAVSATGNGTVFDVSGLSTVGLEISGTFVGTLTFQGRIMGGTWTAVQAENLNDGVIATTSTAVGLFRIPVAGLDEFRVTVTWTSGTSVTVEASGTVAASGTTLTDMAVTSVPGALQGPGNPTVDSYTCAVVNLAASTADQVLVATPGASKQIWVYGLAVLANTAAGTFTLQDEDNTALSGTMAVSDEGGIVMPLSGNFAQPWIKVATNKALEADTGVCTLDGVITYGIISV